MTVGVKEDPDAWLYAAFRWRWYFRYPLAMAVVAAGLALGMYLSQTKSEWLAWGLGGIVCLYGIVLAWELSLAVVAISLIYLFWLWAKGWSVVAWVILGALYFGWLIDHRAKLTEDSLNKKIDNLQQQINRLSGHPW